ncbi:MAG: hypothetical protein QOE14_679 [Humisphaera sp.]|nr:hypothetical protein [Humisphaera sp.]
MTTLNRSLPLGQQAPDELIDPPREGAASQQSHTNVGSTERTVSTAAGAILALAGLGRRSLPGLVIAAIGGGLIYRGVSGSCPVYHAMGLDTSDEPRASADPEDYFERGIHVEEALTINKSPWELYEFWRNFENLPKIMSHLESVTVIDEKRSHWVAKAPAIAGGKVEWDAEIINDEPNALIAWRSLENADVDNAGSVRFVPAPGDRGTEVKVVIDYIPPAGRIGKWVAKLFGEEPAQQIEEDLRKFKRVMETGEFATTKGQPRGNCSGGGYREE